MNITTYTISKSIFEAIRNEQWEKKDITHCFDRFNGTYARLAIDWYNGNSKILEQFSPTLFPPNSQTGQCMGMIGKELKESCRKPKTKMKRNVTNIEMGIPNYGFRDICARTDNKILIVSDRNKWNNTYNKGGGVKCVYKNNSLKIKEPEEIDAHRFWQKMLNLPKNIIIIIKRKIYINYNKKGFQIVGNNNAGLK